MTTNKLDPELRAAVQQAAICELTRIAGRQRRASMSIHVDSILRIASDIADRVPSMLTTAADPADLTEQRVREVVKATLYSAIQADGPTTTEDEADAIAARAAKELAGAAVGGEVDAKACPCLHTAPCHDSCTCVCPLSSSGCHRCCTYGSPDQQQAKAEFLATAFDRAAGDSDGVAMDFRSGFAIGLERGHDTAHVRAEVTEEMVREDREVCERALQQHMDGVSLATAFDRMIAGCPVHDGAIHGGEAEELRKGIEILIELGGATKRDMQALLDLVNARDSLARLERQDIVDVIRRLNETSERATDVRHVPMRLVHQSVLDELMALAGGAR